MACPNELFQYSLASALMDGVASDGMPISELIKHGDHGLGTFRHMDGEMIIIDGAVYAMRADATVKLLDPAGDAVHPFAQITKFEAQTSMRAKLSNKHHIMDILNQLLPNARNQFVAIRIAGRFKSMTVRTAEGQQFRGEKLVEVAKRQRVYTFEDVKGTMVGFRSPGYMHGIGIAGDHLHFINEEKTQGGHLLAVETDEEVEIWAAPIVKMQLDLPSCDDEFNEAKLELDGQGLTSVEG